MVKGSGPEAWLGLNEYTPREPFRTFHARDKRWAVMVAHRRAGKTVACVADLVLDALFTRKQDARYAYIAPQFNQAKDIAWLYVKRLTADIPGVDYNEAELRANLPNGAQVRLFGADNPDRLRGMYLDGAILDEHADMKPTVWGQVVRPMLADRQGWAAFIGTPKGYNEFFDLWELARGDTSWFTLMLQASTSGLIEQSEIDAMKKEMSDEQFRQELECDFSASNIGAILGRYVEEAERDKRILDADLYDPEWPVDVSCDIGFRDTAAWWFWQRRPDGFHLVDYDEDSGLDAQDWIERLYKKRYDLGKIYLPHDARAKTFATKRSVVEQFIAEFSPEGVRVVPQMKTQDRIDAARRIMPKCRFHRVKCKQGLDGLRSWSFKYDAEKKTFSKDPDHNWASHPGDGFSYGALVMLERPEAEKNKHDPLKFVHEPVKWDDEIWEQDVKVDRI